MYNINQKEKTNYIQLTIINCKCWNMQEIPCIKNDADKEKKRIFVCLKFPNSLYKIY